MYTICGSARIDVVAGSGQKPVGSRQREIGSEQQAEIRKSDRLLIKGSRTPVINYRSRVTGDWRTRIRKETMLLTKWEPIAGDRRPKTWKKRNLLTKGKQQPVASMQIIRENDRSMTKRIHAGPAVFRRAAS